MLETAFSFLFYSLIPYGQALAFALLFLPNPIWLSIHPSVL